MKRRLVERIIMETNNYTEIEQLIAGFLHGTISKEETVKLLNWIKESDENRIRFMHLKNLWASTEQLPISTEKALNKVLKEIEHKDIKINFIQTWQRLAAVLLLPLLISTIWLIYSNVHKSLQSNNLETRIEAPFGSFANFELPDGSKVWLNAGSSLVYPSTFDRKSRHVHLIGEAYFEVKSNPECPFYVNTSYFDVKATGTKFNVTAYKNEINHSVSLIEGKVAVSRTEPSGSQTILSVLKPNEHLSYNVKNGKVSILADDQYKYIAWKDGKLVFRNDLLSDVARKISRQYNIDIEVVEDSVKQYRFRATFENEPLNELLRLLKLSSPIDYKEVEPALQSDGTFSKRKIIIYSAKK